MSERDSDIREILTEGFSTFEPANTSVSFVYFDEWENPTTGISQVYDFESDNEGFSTNEPSNTTVCLEYTFDEPMNTSLGACP